jgi:sec-independent protein translocase protein TatB
MFDIGWSELLVVGIVALVVIGPKDLPKVFRAAGQMIAKVRAMAGEFQGQFQDAMREAEIADLKKEAENLAQSARAAVENPIQSIQNDIQKSIEPPDSASPPSSATDAQINEAIPAPPQEPPVSIETAAVAPVQPETEAPAAPPQKQGSGS